MSRRTRQRNTALVAGAVLLPLLGLGHVSAEPAPTTSVDVAGNPLSDRRSSDTPPGPAESPPPSSSDSPPPREPTPAERAVDFARRQVGKPYRYGADGPDSYDCSGLTLRAWEAGGTSLPHSSKAQWNATTRVPLSDIQVGDLVFFGNPIHHVGIYIGDGQMVEAPRSGKQVRYGSIDRRDLAGVGRP